MHFDYDDETKALIERVEAFMDAEVYPAEPTLHEQIEQLDVDDSWRFPAIVGEVAQKAKAQGLWNFFLPEQTSTAPA